ncbi:retrovirus-related pol polyprotein from transposon tnt 1-94, partial [Nicotiana attenuata]
PIPVTHKQAQKDSNWRAAMNSEFDALMKNQTWELVPPDRTRNWLFRIKTNSDGSIDRYKARLVAKGFTQRPGVDFHKTFSPVVKPTTIRTVLTLVVHNNWALHQIDVNNAFLHGKLHEDVYMSQPTGYENLDHPDYCDNSLFVMHNPRVTIYVLIYVDDLILTGSNETLIQHVISSLSKKFSLKYLGLLHYFLGIEVYRDADGLFLSQSKYIQEVLHDTQMQDYKGLQSPMSTSTKLLLDDGAPKTDGKEYRSVLGKLQYLSFTRPDITYSVNKLTQFNSPFVVHWKAVKRILRYLKETSQHGIRISPQPSTALYTYADADWAGD